MGLSSTNPNNDISALQVFADFGSTLQRLAPIINDPKALAKFVEDSYALPEKQQAKLQEATDKIAAYQQLVMQNETQLNDLEQLHVELDEKKAALDKQGADLQTLKISLDNTKNSLSAQSEDLKTRERALAQGQADLATGNAKLNQDKADFARGVQDFADQQTEAKEREKQVIDLLSNKSA